MATHLLYLLCVRCCFMYFSSIVSFNPSDSCIRQLLLFSFSVRKLKHREAEGPRESSSRTIPRTQAWGVCISVNMVHGKTDGFLYLNSSNSSSESAHLHQWFPLGGPQTRSHLWVWQKRQFLTPVQTTESEAPGLGPRDVSESPLGDSDTSQSLSITALWLLGGVMVGAGKHRVWGWASSELSTLHELRVPYALTRKPAEAGLLWGLVTFRDAVFLYHSTAVNEEYCPWPFFPGWGIFRTYPWVSKVLTRDLVAGLQSDSTGEIQLEPPVDALKSLPLMHGLPFSGTAVDVLKVVESIWQPSGFSLSPMLLLFSKRHTRLSACFLLKKWQPPKNFGLRYSNCRTNGIVGDHYKILSKLSLHASKSKKLIHCRYTVEREN